MQACSKIDMPYTTTLAYHLKSSELIKNQNHKNSQVELII